MKSVDRRDFLKLSGIAGVTFTAGLFPGAQASAQAAGDFHFVHYGARAMGGAAMLITEMTCVAPDARITPGCTGLWNDTQEAAWKRIGASPPVSTINEPSRASISVTGV